MNNYIIKGIRILALIALIIGLLLLRAASMAQAGSLYLPLIMVGGIATPTATPPPYPAPGWIILPPVCGDQVAPIETFTDVGTTATLAGVHGIYARACVAGLQTLMLTCISYDGLGAGTTDIRLMRGDVTVAKLYVLDRAYDGSEWLRLCIPFELRDGDADKVAVYSTEDGIYAAGAFLPTPLPTPRPTREGNAGLEGMPVIEAKRTQAGGDDTRGRPTPRNQNDHATVKPLALMEYLCELTKTPTGGRGA